MNISPTTAEGIELDNGYYFIGTTNISVLDVLDCVKEGFSFERIQRVFQLTDQEIVNVQQFLQAYEDKLELQYNEEIRKFRNEVLSRLRGTHRPSWKEPARGFMILALGIFMIYSWATNQTDILSQIFLISFGTLISILSLFHIYVQFQSVYKFQEYVVNAWNGIPSRSFFIVPSDITRIKISHLTKDGSSLFIQDIKNQWHTMRCTESMNIIFTSWTEHWTFDPSLHFKTYRE